MIVFGLTGGSGAGKSAAAEIFRELGVYVIDADKVARKVVEKGRPCLEELRCEFGNGIISLDGTLDRRSLGDIVFTDENKLKSLNKITHKYIKEEILSELALTDCEMAAIDGAVLIGSDIAELCSFMVSVAADTDIRLKRITERDNLTRERAKNRLNSQPDNDFYIKNSKYIVYNNGSTAELALKIKDIYEEIKENEV